MNIKVVDKPDVRPPERGRPTPYKELYEAVRGVVGQPQALEVSFNTPAEAQKAKQALYSWRHRAGCKVAINHKSDKTLLVWCYDDNA